MSDDEHRYEDCILFAVGLYGLVELIRTWKTRGAEVREESPMQQEITS